MRGWCGAAADGRCAARYRPATCCAPAGAAASPSIWGPSGSRSKRSPRPWFLDDPDRLACLASACALAERALPERHPYGPLFDGLVALIEALKAGGEGWGAVYVRWELGLLEQLGFGLDLERCAVTGARRALAWVSPRTGRAVTAAVGEPYRDGLLPLPGFLTGGAFGGAAEVNDGLRLAGHFLARHLFVQGPAGPAAGARPIRGAHGSRGHKMR